MELLFSYGTLQQGNVQIETFGRRLEGRKDCLPGYVVGEVEIRDEQVIATSGKKVHPILKYTGCLEDEVTGTVFELTAAELDQADRYEVEEYARVSAPLKSGRVAWIYTSAEQVS